MSNDITKKVEKCLQKVAEMKKNNEDKEQIVGYISNTLDELVPGEDLVFECAPLYYELGSVIMDIIHERDANEDEEGDELFDDDVQIVIENLEGANHLYSNCEHPENYKVEMQKVKLLLGEAYILGGNYPLAEEILTDCLKNYQELKKGNSREVADVLYNLGVVQLAVAVTLALDSEDEENLAEEAEKKAKEAWKSLTDCQIMLCHVCLDKAIAEKIVEKKETDVLKQVLSLKDKSVQELVEIVSALNDNIESALNFDVEEEIEKNKEELDASRDLLKELIEKEQQDEDDEEDEDFDEEEEEEEEEDIVIEDVKSMKRKGDSEEQDSKRRK